MTLRFVMRTIDPALPRIGTDFMTLRVALRFLSLTPPSSQSIFARISESGPWSCSRCHQVELL